MDCDWRVQVTNKQLDILRLRGLEARSTKLTEGAAIADDVTEGCSGEQDTPWIQCRL